VKITRHVFRIRFLGVLLVLAAAAVSRSAGAQTAPGAPAHVSVHGPEEWVALGRALIADRETWRPLPGIGTLAEVGVDSVEIWVAPELGDDVPPELRMHEAWVAGAASPSVGRIALRTGPGLAGPAGLRTVLRHELAHVALWAATGGNHPRWLTEGYAQYASGEWGWDEAWQLQSTFLRRGAASLADIDLRFRSHPTDARLGYLLSYTAVHQIAALGGEAGLRALFRRLREGDTFDDALRDTFGITVEAFEARWKRTLIDRYGWLYLLSRAGVFWGGVTLLVLFVALRRSRRDRRRLDALRAAEATSRWEAESWEGDGVAGPPATGASTDPGHDPSGQAEIRDGVD